MIDHARQRRELISAFNQRDWPRVMESATPLLELFPDDADIHFIAGLAETELGRLGPAVRLLRRAFLLDQRRS